MRFPSYVILVFLQNLIIPLIMVIYNLSSYISMGPDMSCSEAKDTKREEAHYQVLELKDSATRKDIVDAYQRLSMKHHPDKGGNQECFNAIVADYNCLSDSVEKNAMIAAKRQKGDGVPSYFIVQPSAVVSSSSCLSVIIMSVADVVKTFVDSNAHSSEIIAACQHNEKLALAVIVNPVLLEKLDYQVLYLAEIHPKVALYVISNSKGFSQYFYLTIRMLKIALKHPSVALLIVARDNIITYFSKSAINKLHRAYPGIIQTVGEDSVFRKRASAGRVVRPYFQDQTTVSGKTFMEALKVAKYDNKSLLSDVGFLLAIAKSIPEQKQMAYIQKLPLLKAVGIEEELRSRPSIDYMGLCLFLSVGNACFNRNFISLYSLLSKFKNQQVFEKVKLIEKFIKYELSDYLGRFDVDKFQAYQRHFDAPMLKFLCSVLFNGPEKSSESKERATREYVGIQYIPQFILAYLKQRMLNSKSLHIDGIDSVVSFFAKETGIEVEWGANLDLLLVEILEGLVVAGGGEVAMLKFYSRSFSLDDSSSWHVLHDFFHRRSDEDPTDYSKNPWKTPAAQSVVKKILEIDAKDSLGDLSFKKMQCFVGKCTLKNAQWLQHVPELANKFSVYRCFMRSNESGGLEVVPRVNSGVANRFFYDSLVTLPKAKRIGFLKLFPKDYLYLFALKFYMRGRQLDDRISLLMLSCCGLEKENRFGFLKAILSPGGSPDMQMLSALDDFIGEEILDDKKEVDTKKFAEYALCRDVGMITILLEFVAAFGGTKVEDTWRNSNIIKVLIHYFSKSSSVASVSPKSSEKGEKKGPDQASLNGFMLSDVDQQSILKYLKEAPVIFVSVMQSVRLLQFREYNDRPDVIVKKLIVLMNQIHRKPCLIPIFFPLFASIHIPSEKKDCFSLLREKLFPNKRKDSLGVKPYKTTYALNLLTGHAAYFGRLGLPQTALSVIKDEKIQVTCEKSAANRPLPPSPVASFSEL